MMDYYQVLGVIPDAEAAVIKAAYRALVSIYHPDKNRDPAAQEKTRTINEAYSVLSDPIKKSDYDKSRTTVEHNANSTAFDQTRPFATDPLEKSWSIAVGFYPQLRDRYEYLGKISWRLAFSFKLQLSESQEYQNSYEIAQKLKNEYLLRYFGKDKDIVNYAERLISNSEIQAALHLNEIVTVMGRSVNFLQVMDIVEQKFPGLNNRIKGKYLYRKLVSRDRIYFNFLDANALIELHGGVVKQSLWSQKINLQIDGKKLIFTRLDDLYIFLISHLANVYS